MCSSPTSGRTVRLRVVRAHHPDLVPVPQGTELGAGLGQIANQRPLVRFPGAPAERGSQITHVLFTGLGIYNVTVSSYRQAATPPLLIGRVTAATRVVMQGVIPLGAALPAGLAAVMGVRAALALSLAIDLVPGMLLFFSPVRGVRDLPVDELA